MHLPMSMEGQVAVDLCSGDAHIHGIVFLDGRQRAWIVDGCMGRPPLGAMMQLDGLGEEYKEQCPDMIRAQT